MDDAAIDFMLRAKRTCYAGNGAQIAPFRPSSHDFLYAEGELQYSTATWAVSILPAKRPCGEAMSPFGL